MAKAGAAMPRVTAIRTAPAIRLNVLGVIRVLQAGHPALEGKNLWALSYSVRDRAGMPPRLPILEARGRDAARSLIRGASITSACGYLLRAKRPDPARRIQPGS
jgi:hypothetical protein